MEKSVTEGMRKLQEVLRKRAREMSQELEACAESLRSGSCSCEVLDTAYSIAHSLHGAGEPYGYPCLSEMGAGLENVIAALRAGTLAATEQVAALIDSGAAALKDLAEGRSEDGAIRQRISGLAWRCESTLHNGQLAD